MLNALRKIACSCAHLLLKLTAEWIEQIENMTRFFTETQAKMKFVLSSRDTSIHMLGARILPTAG